MKIFIFFVVLAICLTLNAYAAEAPISGVTAICSEHYGSHDTSGNGQFSPNNVVNGDGLTHYGVDATHQTSDYTWGHWFQTFFIDQGQTIDKAWIRFDLGKEYYIDEMYVWNFCGGGAQDAGMKNVIITYSEDGVEWETLGKYVFAEADVTGSQIAATNDINGRPIQFYGAYARFVKITVDGAKNSGNYGRGSGGEDNQEVVGLAAVMFTEAENTAGGVGSSEESSGSPPQKAIIFTVSGIVITAAVLTAVFKFISKKNPKTSVRNKIYLSSVSVLLLGLLAWCPLMTVMENFSILEFDDNRNYKDPARTYEDVPFASVMNKMEDGKASLENMYTNYLPAYDRVVGRLSDTENSVQMKFLSLFSPKTEIPNSDDLNGEDFIDTKSINFTAMYTREDAERRYYIIQPYDFIEPAMKMSPENLRVNMLRQLGEINRLIESCPVDFYLYIIKTMQDERYFNDIIPDEYCTADLFNEFWDGIKGEAGKDFFKIDTLDKKLKKAFKTDHHWNAAGVYEAYCDIIAMISKNSPEIGKPLPVKNIKTYPNIQMRGSWAAQAGYARFYEEFFVYEYDLPPAVRGTDIQSNAARFDAGEFDNINGGNPFFDCYHSYYHARRLYAYQNNTGRNLLIIADSLSYWSGWLIAANFDRTYLIFPWDNADIDFTQYIINNGITDVLVMLYAPAVVYNIARTSDLEHLLTK